MTERWYIEKTDPPMRSTHSSSPLPWAAYYDEGNSAGAHFLGAAATVTHALDLLRAAYEKSPKGYGTVVVKTCEGAEAVLLAEPLKHDIRLPEQVAPIPFRLD